MPADPMRNAGKTSGQYRSFGPEKGKHRDAASAIHSPRRINHFEFILCDSEPVHVTAKPARPNGSLPSSQHGVPVAKGVGHIHVHGSCQRAPVEYLIPILGIDQEEGYPP